MTISAIANPFAQIFGLGSVGLTGYAYIGVQNMDPKTHPQAVWWAANGTDPATQPLQVIGGYIQNAGQPAAAYTDGAFSMTVETLNGMVIFTNENVPPSDSANNKLDRDLSNVSATDNQKTAFRAVVYDDFSTMIAPGAVGDNVVDDTDAIQAALDTGRNIVLPAGKTFKVTAPLTMQSNNQYFGGNGVLDFRGNCGVLITNGCAGAQVELIVNAPSHTGTAITVNNADRVRIKRLLGNDVFNTIWVQKSNLTSIDWAWVEARGKGLTWWGDASNRSDVLDIGLCVIDCADTEYALDWNGNCNSLECRALHMVGGKGAIVHNTTGGADPIIGRFGFIASDFSKADGLRIEVGQDFDITAPYLQGATESGLYVASGIDTRRVRVQGGKIQGNGRYGIENHSTGVVAYDGSGDLAGNTLGETFGPVWTRSPRFVVDDLFYAALSGSDPNFNFDDTDYLGFVRSTNTLFATIAGATIFHANATSFVPDKLLALPGSTTAGAPFNFVAGTAPTSPNNGDVWFDGTNYKAQIGGVTKTFTLT